MEAAMDNRINQIRRQIKALRVSMMEAEAIMHGQVKRGEDCSFVAGDVLKMRAVMSLLVRERAQLGDNEPIIVTANFIPRRASRAVAVARSGKQRLSSVAHGA
jgi:hypothetical protein